MNNLIQQGQGVLVNLAPDRIWQQRSGSLLLWCLTGSIVGWSTATQGVGLLDHYCSLMTPAVVQFCARLDFAVDDVEGGKGLTVSEVRALLSASAMLTCPVPAAQSASGITHARLIPVIT